MSDSVNHPAHYAEGWSNGAEVIDITENLNFNRGNAVKYIARAGKKAYDKELEDLQKARWYIDREITRLAGPRAVDDPEIMEPRVWERLLDVPSTVNVVDRGGDLYAYKSGWRWGRYETPIKAEDWDRYGDYGPYTEVFS